MPIAPLLTVVAVVLVALTGILLTVRGWPFTAGLTTIHKLASLAVVAVAGLGLYRLLRSPGAPAVVTAALVATLVLGVADIATGAALTLNRDTPAWIAWSHRIASWVTLATALGSAWLLGA